MTYIPQLRENIKNLQAEIRYQEALVARGCGNPLILNSLRTSLRQFTIQLQDALYLQAEEEAERIDMIREQMLTYHGL